jgi:hypothetical protein
VKPIQWNQDQTLLRAPLLTVTAVQAYVLIRGRNAWNSTWVQNYMGTGAVYLTLVEAKKAAEAQRVQGSVFYIRQIPAMALNSTEGSVLLVEFHSDNSFGKWDTKNGADELVIGTPLSQVITALGRGGLWKTPVPSKHSFITVKTGWDTLETVPPRGSFTRWTSQSQGPNYYLKWNEYSGRYSRGGINAIIRTFNSINTDEARSTAEKEFAALHKEWNRTLTPEETGDMLNEMAAGKSAIEAALELGELFASLEETTASIEQSREEAVLERPTLRLIQGALIERAEDFEPQAQDSIESIPAALTGSSPAQTEV